MIRIGEGFDVHALTSGRKLILGGVEIPHTVGLLGHSDADVATHALMDALLGSLALGDIGQHFPDSSAAYAGADSIELLKTVLRLPEFSDWHIVNADITILAQAPKLGPFREKMRDRLAAAMEIPIAAVSVKFTTTEQLGFVGRQEGIAARAVVLVEKK